MHSNHKVVKELGSKMETLNRLDQLAREHKWFSWTSVGLSTGFLGFDLLNHKATIVASGNQPFSTTNLQAVGQTIASILTHPDETANKFISVSSFTTTQNEILQLLEAESGQKWQVERISSDDLDKLGDQKKGKGDFSYFMFYLRHYFFPDGSTGFLKEEDSANELLGLDKEDMRDTIRKELNFD
ncbi:hypothetical protein MPH_11352 [Macrophomina phaseolina MS6]|uniref:NmrA-like protein n=1 Tax=Macrophomina phaseolina (strain MS6) TaxID=1126212 RepID=K2QPJ7_MACPH|nr:hypothetical protein MPH_11352 [Macrophomina phaseolina MS6]